MAFLTLASRTVLQPSRIVILDSLKTSREPVFVIVDGSVERRSCPIVLNGHDIFKQLESLEFLVMSKHPSLKEKKKKKKKKRESSELDEEKYLF